MTVTKISALIIVLVGGLIAYRLLSVESEVPVAEPLSTTTPAESVVTRPARLPETEVVVAMPSPSEQTDCLSVSELQAHPLVQELLSLRVAISTNGADVEKFRGLDETEVRGYADQGDSAAMVVVGAMSVMRANQADGSEAIDWLVDGGSADIFFDEQQQLSSEAGLALNDAAYWFYQAALNGRVFALQKYGQVRGKLFGGAVGLGWISQEDFDGLNDTQRNELRPINMYHTLALDLSPRPDDGALRSTVRTQTSNDFAVQVQSDIHHEFNMAVVDSGLSPPLVSAADLAEFEALEAQLCTAE